ncbi:MULTISPECIES: antibiotic biosynthesis monooxygenase family protein [Pseudoalteromonas]|jgi:heme-degrading monooxygenase HmoA|uniref:Antibiotic biosynthesis monooxygenase n=2 Tax=Pseudoalteromonas TaxID=53246 RepID=A0AAD0S0M4_9GAMM|nr:MULTISPECIES: antibiotic biosynthesis monooxygenase [Pseudoalteromonas]MAE01365.1 antibiotic biosynthesis monooxygenase [Pseudoalteromonas sp.]AXV65309.1 antibiotic biosynthesis monooxygenase [Pseudoalteromonas donghaensis]MCC9659720.1 antibiotic biosynthesis monooxygenase [Pseudoalteromonas sp. MB41]QLJ06851.1 antibiotic biosynthesis monooxygenase [Pseudoalteromonas sp. JSTW]SFT92554.1 Heme-degrading monooxygenase HmoA [Pseudoalteromonas lipolytica]|tara:strand:- start:5785 stop:6096 length:312 start_codon:yes stop_codon:yes gene_type:complete
MIATTPKPPYYAVIFTNTLSENTAGYEEMANRMVELAEQQPGFLGMESVRDGVGITVSYWQSLDAIKSWKQHVEHLNAQQLGRDKWYNAFTTRIAKVEREYSL